MLSESGDTLAAPVAHASRGGLVPRHRPWSLRTSSELAPTPPVRRRNGEEGERRDGGGMQQEGWEVGEMINKGVEGNAMPWHLHVACSRLTVEAQAPL